MLSVLFLKIHFYTRLGFITHLHRVKCWRQKIKQVYRALYCIVMYFLFCFPMRRHLAVMRGLHCSAVVYSCLSLWHYLPASDNNPILASNCSPHGEHVREFLFPFHSTSVSFPVYFSVVFLFIFTHVTYIFDVFNISVIFQYFSTPFESLLYMPLPLLSLLSTFCLHIPISPTCP